MGWVSGLRPPCRLESGGVCMADRRLRGKRPTEQVCLVRVALVVQVAHRRGHVGVAHPCGHLDDARTVDRKRPERVPQIVEAQRSQLGLRHCALEPPSQSGPVQRLPGRAREHQVVRA